MSALLWLLAGFNLGLHFTELVNGTIHWLDIGGFVAPFIAGLFTK